MADVHLPTALRALEPSFLRALQSVPGGAQDAGMLEHYAASTSEQNFLRMLLVLEGLLTAPSNPAQLAAAVQILAPWRWVSAAQNTILPLSCRLRFVKYQPHALSQNGHATTRV